MARLYEVYVPMYEKGERVQVLLWDEPTRYCGVIVRVYPCYSPHYIPFMYDVYIDSQVIAKRRFFWGKVENDLAWA